MSATDAKTVGSYLTVLSQKPPEEIVRDAYSLAYNHQKTRRDKWRELFLAYHGYVQNKETRYRRANLHFHKIFPQIEMEAARMLTGFFTHRPFAAIIATDQNYVEQAKTREAVQQYYLDKCPNFFISKLRQIKHALLYGCGYTVPTWRTITQKRKKHVKFKLWGAEINGVSDIVEVEDTVYDGLDFQTYSPSEVFPDPFGLTMDQKRYVIIEEWVSAEHLLEIADTGGYDRAAIMACPLNMSGQQEIEYAMRRRELGLENETESDEGIIRLQHYYSRDRFITLANDEKVIRDVDNPFDHKRVPVIQGVKVIDPESFYPIGTARPILANQKFTNLFFNLMAQHALSMAYPSWKYKAGSVDPNFLLSVPNNRIPVRDMDDVDIFQMPEMKRDLAAIMAMCETNIEEATGYFGPQKGYSDVKHTATSDSIFASQGDKRISGDVLVYERMTLTPEAEMCGDLVEQFMPPEIAVRVTGIAGAMYQKVSPEQIRGDFSYRVSGISASINRAIQREQLVELYKLGADAQQQVRLMNGIVVPVPLQDNHYALQQLYEAHERTDAEKFLIRPEVFGEPLNNEALAREPQPPVPYANELHQHPITGAMRNKPWQQNLSQQMNEAIERPERITVA